jgi:Uri superfamily endonuclease
MLGLRAEPGTYLVLLAPGSGRAVTVGRLGRLPLDGGVLVYAGSALGPGGVAARCAHHLRHSDNPRWHLDYLRPHCRLLGFWVAYGAARLEHHWAAALSRLPAAGRPLPGFGASDCACPTHLIRFPGLPAADLLADRLGCGSLVAAEAVSSAPMPPKRR